VVGAGVGTTCGAVAVGSIDDGTCVELVISAGGSVEDVGDDVVATVVDVDDVAACELPDVVDSELLFVLTSRRSSIRVIPLINTSSASAATTILAVARG
jgi:hypothetical protein